MTQTPDTLLHCLRERFGDKIVKDKIATGQLSIDVKPADLLGVCRVLSDDDALGFKQLSDLCGIDYLSFGRADWETEKTTSTGFSRGVSEGVYIDTQEMEDRFAVIYHLLSLTHNQRLRVRCFVSGQPAKLPSVTPIWAGANWFEREAFDLFGIIFEGHPDLRRILTDYGFIGHPFRKDFPLEGNVEVRYDPDQGRVVYQPVSIQNRVLVPKVIRHDNRYVKADASKGAE